MNIIYSAIHTQHRPAYELYDGVRSVYPEVSERIEVIKSALLAENLGKVMHPRRFPVSYLYTVHSKQYVEFLKNKSFSLSKDDNFFPSYFMTDTYAPLTKGTYIAAKEAANIALTGADQLLNGQRLVYSLFRPPGHHADSHSMGGYCYFNNAAVAAEYLSKRGRVAILDIDFHHGNGTQHIFYDRSDVLYVSLHADPSKKYPYISGFANETGIGEGRGFTKNYPLSLDISEELYFKKLQKALIDIQQFAPNFLVLSAGFDTYLHDPIGGLGLSIPFYYNIGKAIQELHLKTLIIQEGGYAVEDLGKIAIKFVKGLGGEENE